MWSVVSTRTLWKGSDRLNTSRGEKMSNTSCAKKLIAVILVFAAAVQLSGCMRFKAPRARLDRDVYSPKQAIKEGGQYLIGPRDELQVSVWRCPELERVVVVRPEDGKVSLPLIGDVMARGRTPKELAEAISGKMAYYVKEPRIAVGVKKMGEKKVFIMGQVLSQGSYRLERNDRIIDLVTRAGGFTDNAVPSCIHIVRGDYDDPKIVRANLDRLIHRADISQNVYLMEGDIVYVPETEIENLNYALRKVFPSLFFAEKLADLKQNIMSGGYDWHEVWNKVGKN
ncbi:MAG: hypothetical protein GF408_05690 [Candidatus Omnitrophica bacterium]|nr:hypothetical protein [Candidatus Omnitrophota bacterium]